nr:hypothetical protein [Vibrio taketomensis]
MNASPVAAANYVMARSMVETRFWQQTSLPSPLSHPPSRALLVY